MKSTILVVLLAMFLAIGGCGGHSGGGGGGGDSSAAPSDGGGNDGGTPPPGDSGTPPGSPTPPGTPAPPGSPAPAPGGGNGGNGSITLSVQWPGQALTTLSSGPMNINPATGWLRIRASDGGSTNLFADVIRPASLATIDNVPAGTYTVDVLGFGGLNNATPVLNDFGSTGATVVVTPGNTTNVPVLSLTSSSVSFTNPVGPSLPIGSVQTLGMTFVNWPPVLQQAAITFFATCSTYPVNCGGLQQLCSPPVSNLPTRSCQATMPSGTDVTFDASIDGGAYSILSGPLPAGLPTLFPVGYNGVSQINVFSGNFPLQSTGSISLIIN